MQARAVACREWLVQHGVDRGRLRAAPQDGSMREVRFEPMTAEAAAKAAEAAEVESAAAAITRVMGGKKLEFGRNAWDLDHAAVNAQILASVAGVMREYPAISLKLTAVQNGSGSDDPEWFRQKVQKYLSENGGDVFLPEMATSQAQDWAEIGRRLRREDLSMPGRDEAESRGTAERRRSWLCRRGASLAASGW